MLKFFNTQIGSIIFLAIIAILAVAVISLTVIKAVKTKKCPPWMIALSVILGVLLVGMIFISIQMGSSAPSATPTPYDYSTGDSDEIAIPDLVCERSGDVVTLVYINAESDGCYIANDDNMIDLSTGEPGVSLSNQAVFDLFYDEVDTSNAICIIAYNWQFYAVEEVDGKLFVSGLDGIFMSFEDFCYLAVNWQQEYPTATGGVGLA